MSTDLSPTTDIRLRKTAFDSSLDGELSRQGSADDRRLIATKSCSRSGRRPPAPRRYADCWSPSGSGWIALASRPIRPQPTPTPPVRQILRTECRISRDDRKSPSPSPAAFRQAHRASPAAEVREGNAMTVDLQKLIARGESKTLELKRSTAELRGAFQTICAFANGAGGLVLIGVNPDGKIVGQQIGDQTLQ